MTKDPSIRFDDEQKLARHILHLARSHPQRYLVGIAGIPGAGKSILARHLKDAIGHIAQKPEMAAVVPLDGFHRSNADLAQLGLLERKGSPESFHVQSFYARLHELKRGHAPVTLPIYSRELHESIPDAIEVRPEHAIVLVEGNYLLCDFGPWRAIASLFHLTVYVEARLDQARQRVIERHVRGGLSHREAVEKYERNDKPNGELIAPAQSHADVIFAVP